MHSTTNILPFNSIIIIILSLVSLLLILAVFLIIVMLRRLRSVGKSGCCKESNGGVHNTTTTITTCRFVARTAIDFNSSPADVKANCLYGASMRKPAIGRYRGVQVFTYKELELATDNFNEANVIGNGGSSVVYKGILVDGTVAAVKRLRRERKQDQHLRAKVSDFGLAKMGSDKINGQISARVPRSTGYIAPEYASTGKLTTKSDVYSYGVVLLQLLTGRVPVDIKRPPGEHVLVSWALPRLTNRDKVEEMVDPAIQGQYSKKDLIQVAAIAVMCVQPEADYRPLMVDVVQSLVPIVKNFNSVNSPSFSRFSRRTTSPKY
ncbi:hypothetical protein GQ457_06G020580 [Hibiscus cannabinus]